MTDEGRELFIETMQAMDPDKNSIVYASLSLQSEGGQFPEFEELETIVEELYGADYIDILNRSLSGIKRKY